MAKWLPGFRSAGGATANEPQPFELICECSQRHSGVRRSGHQRIVCKTCGTSLFVLPRDPYPPPPNAERIKKKPRPKKTECESRGPDDDPAPVRVSRHKRRRERQGQGQSAVTNAASATSSAFLIAASTAGRSTRAAAQGVSDASIRAARGFLDFWTPLKLTALGICVLIAAITAWSLHARRVERAERGLNPAIEEGLAALQEGNLATASSRLATAVAALDLLGKSDRHARSVRQAAREAQTLNGLVPESLIGLLEEADEYVTKAEADRPDPEADPEADPPPPLDADWVNRFGALYEGSWVVLEAPVKKLEPTEDEPRRYEVAFPIRVGTKSRRAELRADFSVFDQLDIGAAPRTAIFGGRLESCRFLEHNGRFRVTLAPESGFVWANLPTYRQLGFGFSDWHSEDEVRGLLTEQANAAGVDALVEEASREGPALAPN